MQIPPDPTAGRGVVVAAGERKGAGAGAEAWRPEEEWLGGDLTAGGGGTP